MGLLYTLFGRTSNLEQLIKFTRGQGPIGVDLVVDRFDDRLDRVNGCIQVVYRTVVENRGKYFNKDIGYCRRHFCFFNHETYRDAVGESLRRLEREFYFCQKRDKILCLLNINGSYLTKLGKEMVMEKAGRLCLTGV